MRSGPYSTETPGIVCVGGGAGGSGHYTHQAFGEEGGTQTWQTIRAYTYQREAGATLGAYRRQEFGKEMDALKPYRQRGWEGEARARCVKTL